MAYNNDSWTLRFIIVYLVAFCDYLYITGNSFADLINFAIFAEWMTMAEVFHLCLMANSNVEE